MNTKETAFFAKLTELFPDVETSGTYTRKQIEVTTASLSLKSPAFYMTQNKISRGLYALPTNSVVSSVVPSPKKQSVVTFEKLSLVPEVDKNFVPFGNYNDLESIIKSGIFYPSYVYGPTGNGKSTMIEQICAKHKKNLIRVNLNMMTDEDQLIGSKTLTDGNVEVVEGPVLVAMRTGSILMCLEENERIKVGTLANNNDTKLSDMEIGKEYPVISYNLENSEFENDIGMVLAESYRDDLYVIEFDDGSTITMTSDHPVIVEGNYEKSIIEGLLVGDFVISL